MNLGEIISKLETMNPDNQIMIEKGGAEFTPGLFGSYRGYYEDLGLSVLDLNENHQTVQDFLNKCNECIGKQFEGYKGGLYTMTILTDLWCSEYGAAEGWKIYDVVDIGKAILIKTKEQW